MMILEEEFVLHPENIDVVDALGRTPLVWAAARGNELSVALILGADADPNTLDTIDRCNFVCCRAKSYRLCSFVA
jgi:ankyrin repeat protein